MTDGNLTRVVRGITQEWMDQGYYIQVKGGGVVRYKLDSLPGDIIDRNDLE